MQAPFSSRNKDLAKRWSRWQPDVGAAAHDLRADGQPERRKTGKHRGEVSLQDFDPADKPFSTGEKNQDKALVESLALELDELQNLFYADKRYKLLVILQGTDTSGKDEIGRAHV